MTRLLTYVLVTLAVVLCSASSAGAVTNPQQGVYYSCQDTSCLTYMDWMHNVGIHLFILPISSSTAQGSAIAAHMFAQGDRVWWNVPRNAANTGASWTTASKNWAGTGGYYTWDEPALHHDDPLLVALYNQGIRNLAPGEDTAIGHWSGCTSAGQHDASDPHAGDLSYAGAICYPVTNHSGPGGADAGSVYGAFKAQHDISVAHGTHAFAVPKAFCWCDPDVAGQGPSGDKFPSAPEVSTMLNCARKANVEKVIWWGLTTWDNMLFTDGAQWNSRWEDWTSGVQAAYSDPGTCN